MLKLLIPTLTLIGFVQLGHMADAHTGKGYTLGQRKVKDYVLDKAEDEARSATVQKINHITKPTMSKKQADEAVRYVLAKEWE